MKAIIIALTLAALAASNADAQVVNARAGESRSLRLDAGFEHGAVLELGYAQPLDAPIRLDLVARVDLPAVPLPTDGGAQLGVAAGFVAPSGLGVSPRALATLRWVDGSLYGVAQLGALFGVAAGYFGQRGLVALDLEWDKSLVTRVSGREMTGAGWFGSGGGILRGGIAANAAVTSRVVLSLRAGVALTEALNMTPGFPFYALVGGAARF